MASYGYLDGGAFAGVRVYLPPSLDPTQMNIFDRLLAEDRISHEEEIMALEGVTSAVTENPALIDPGHAVATVLERVLATCWISPADGEKARWIIRSRRLRPEDEVRQMGAMSGSAFVPFRDPIPGFALGTPAISIVSPGGRAVAVDAPQSEPLGPLQAGRQRRRRQRRRQLPLLSLHTIFELPEDEDSIRAAERDPYSTGPGRTPRLSRRPLPSPPSDSRPRRAGPSGGGATGSTFTGLSSHPVTPGTFAGLSSHPVTPGAFAGPLSSHPVSNVPSDDLVGCSLIPIDPAVGRSPIPISPAVAKRARLADLHALIRKVGPSPLPHQFSDAAWALLAPGLRGAYEAQERRRQRAATVARRWALAERVAKEMGVDAYDEDPDSPTFVYHNGALWSRVNAEEKREKKAEEEAAQKQRKAEQDAAQKQREIEKRIAELEQQKADLQAEIAEDDAIVAKGGEDDDDDDDADMELLEYEGRKSEEREYQQQQQPQSLPFKCRWGGRRCVHEAQFATAEQLVDHVQGVHGSPRHREFMGMLRWHCHWPGCREFGVRWTEPEAHDHLRAHCREADAAARRR
ncbi:hypothetical protein GGR56DRAFT_677434 [Xylariaceae sp. FL0804]|nr:hypothetical protein GGR56DRAFT_677434 [Xylariaceae sp. FL0804]